MGDVKSNISRNIVNLRMAHGMTQAELAEKLNYSDKAVSKWERGGSLPDVTVLVSIAELFGVSLDYLVREEHEPEIVPDEEYQIALETRKKQKNRRHVGIVLLSVCLVWLIAVFTFIFLRGAQVPGNRAWLCYVYAVPASAVVLLVLCSIWFRRSLIFINLSVLMWSLLAAVYISLLMFAGVNFWLVFLLGVPGQIMILLWAGAFRGTFEDKRKETEK